MGSGERREREKDEVRTRILDVARELFAAEGFTSVTMRRIADGLEYTPGALYRHFPDKAALLQALVVADYASFSHAFQALGRIADPLERIRRAGEAYVAFGLSHPHHYRLLFMTPEPAGGAIAPIAAAGDPRADAYEFLHQAVLAAAAAGQLRKDLTDLDAVTRLLWAGVHGVVSLAINGRTGWPPRSVRPLARLVIDVLMRGLTAPEKSRTKRKPGGRT
jgi:AcrR family transcriptional regulator